MIIDDTVAQAVFDDLYVRARGSCECTRSDCDHDGHRCFAELSGGVVIVPRLGMFAAEQRLFGRLVCRSCARRSSIPAKQAERGD